MPVQPLAALLCVVLTVVRCQPYPRFEFQDRTFVNNSYIFRGDVGVGADALNCTTDNTDCCTNPDVENWTDEEGGAVHQGASGATTIYVTRGDGVVSLNRMTGGSSGMWRCDIPDSSGVMQSIYIYTGTSTSGRLTLAIISFTLHTEPNVSPPEFTLTCRSEGGPATTVSWQRNEVTVEENGDHKTSQIIVDTSASPVYENRLRVSGREGGTYQCTVENNRNDPTFPDDSFTVDVAGEPTNLAAVPQSDTSIEVNWDSPGSPATGYVIYYQPEGGAVSRVAINGENTESHQLGGLQSGVTYRISIVSQSDHLPSAVVGPVTATTNSVSSPQVTVRSSGSATVGSSYTLTCTVTLPTEVVVTPDVQWEGPGLSGDTTGTVTGSGGTYTSELSLNPLSPSHGGDYTCKATYTVDGQTSPEEMDSITVTVMIPPPSLTLVIRDNRVPYVGNDITLVCEIELPGTVSASDVDVSVKWLKGGSEFSGVSGRVTVVPPASSGSILQSTVSFSPLLFSDGGRYECEATLTPQQGTSYTPGVASEGLQLTVGVPSLVVQTRPSSIRILNVPPYNQFTVTCTASAEVNGQHVPLEMTIEWIRRSKPSSGSTSFENVPSTDYVTTGSPEDGYQSILTTTETDTVNTISYRCRARHTEAAKVTDSTVEVVGPMEPVTPEAISARDIQDISATIQWTVSSIAYTPETYVVEYGTSRDNRNLTSYPQHSGPDITIGSRNYSVQLSGLKAGTQYYFVVVANNSDDRATSSSVERFSTTPGLVSFINVENVNSSSLNISWGPPSPANGVITHYLVWVNSSSQHTQTNIPAPDMRVMVDGLEPGVPYKVSVAAVNTAGRGAWNIAGAVFFTMDLKPQAPPDVQATVMNSSFVRVTWTLLTDEEAQGTVLSYIVTYSDGVVTQNITVSPDQDYVVLSDLTPGAAYTVRVSARTSVGVGALSTTHVTVQVDSPGLLSIPDGMSFTLDSELNAEVPQFTLTCVSTGVPPTTVTWTRDSEPVSGGMTVLDDPVTAQYTHTLTVTGRLGGLYQCTASNQWSQAMGGLTVRTVEPPTDILVHQSIPNTLQVRWIPPSPLGHVTGYRIYYDGDDDSSGTLDITGGMSHSQVLTGLSSSVSYTLSLVALSAHLPSPVVNYGQSIPMMPQPSVTVDRTRATSASVNWSGSFGAERYEVMYERGTGGQQEGHCPGQSHSGLVKVSAPSTTATISGLEEFSTYLITVTARRGKHSFVKSETIPLMTSSAGSHVPPQNIMASVQTSTSIFVSWNPITNCSDINGNITGWLVCYSDSNNYTQLIPGSNQESGSTTLVGLLFHTTYWIQVAAVNSDGHTGVFSEPIMATTMGNSPPTMSTNIRNATAIEVTWNTTQPAGWNTSHIVHHFAYYTRGHHLITRLSKDLPWNTVSIVVNVKESLYKVEHIFSISSNLVFRGKTHTGLVANISVEFDEAYVQLQFGPVNHCITWTSDQAQQIEEQLKFEIMETLLPKCPMCAGSLIRRGVFLCKSSPTMATYRSTLLNIGIPGLTNASSLVSYVQDWVAAGPVVRLDWLLVHINKDCPVAVHQFSDPECPTPHFLQPDLINAVSGVVNTCAIQNLGTQICQNP